MNSVLKKILGVALSIFTVIYFGYQAYRFMYVPYSTEVALIDDYTDQLEVDGIAIKSEQLLEKPAAGVVKYVNSNAKKVVAQTTVASVYANEDDLIKHEIIEKKTAELDMLTSLESKKASLVRNTQDITQNVRKEQAEIIGLVDSDEFTDIDKASTAYFEQMLRRDIVLTPDISFSEKIATLTTDIQTLQSQLSSEGTQINVPVSGFFTNLTDGYETLVPETTIGDLSLEHMESLLNNSVTVPANSVGKVITSTSFYFMATFDITQRERLVVDSTVKLEFPESAGYEIKAIVKGINAPDGAEKGVVLLESNNMNNSVVDLRIEHASIVFDASQGIKFPKKSMRIIKEEITDDNDKKQTISTPGVYVNMGQIVKFKKIDIAYETEDYIISNPTVDQSYLQLYDEIILEGDNLYDGKPI